MHCWNIKACKNKIKRSVISGDTVTVLVHNVRSFPRHADDVVSDNKIYRSARQATRFYLQNNRNAEFFSILILITLKINF